MVANAGATSRAMLLEAARLLNPMLDRVVFVGGATTWLFLSDPAAPEVRPTKDVDVIVEIGSLVQYHRLEQELHDIGFRQPMVGGGPICRWTFGELTLDVMPTDSTILGFSNQWYLEALRYATERVLDPGVTILCVTAPYFVATKLEAFRGRGRGDFYASADLEDIVAVIDGRRELLEELRQMRREVRSFVAEGARGFLENEDFRQALPGHLLVGDESPDRQSMFLKRLEQIAAL